MSFLTEATLHNPPVLDAIGSTPLLDLSGLAGEDHARLFAKYEGANPTGSMKDRMALAMIETAEREGRLEPGRPVVEATGGSTGTSLAMVCAAKGRPIHLVTADCFAPQKITAMRALGADVTVLETEGRVYPGLRDAMDRRADEIVKETGAYWIDQFGNPDQLIGYRALATEILADAPDVSHFVTVVGTGGSAMGVSQGFRELGRDVHVTIVEPSESPYLSEGTGGEHGVDGVASIPDPPLLDEALYDEVVAVPEAHGGRMVQRLAREQGLLVGTSSGLNLAAAEEVAARVGPDGLVVTLLVDTGLKYLGNGSRG